MSRPILATLAALAIVAVLAGLYPFAYHRLFCPLCRRRRALKRASKP